MDPLKRSTTATSRLLNLFCSFDLLRLKNKSSGIRWYYYKLEFYCFLYYLSTNIYVNFSFICCISWLLTRWKTTVCLLRKWGLKLSNHSSSRMIFSFNTYRVGFSHLKDPELENDLSHQWFKGDLCFLNRYRGNYKWYTGCQITATLLGLVSWWMAVSLSWR